MLKDALAGLPTRPVLYLSSIVLVVGLGYHYLSTYRECSTHAGLREGLRAAIGTSAAGGLPVKLAEVTDFVWDRAEILVNYKPGGSGTDCPFQWDWSRDLREKLVAGDLLDVIVFVHDGRLVNYLEYRRDWAEFVDIRNPYTPDTAVFVVSPSPTRPGAYILTPLL